ncbi:hypothetical protein FGO68_gene6493 [Halteria grandinella]|uniref:Uncharacterized protein n=1 Tax=Halteria grandinella TaxID=5974 RepID=A0A8J8NMT5_HALGN|nr:hypothetical protein FGO68_gene6493 [Halteria grandinella]
MSDNAAAQMAAFYKEHPELQDSKAVNPPAAASGPLAQPAVAKGNDQLQGSSSLAKVGQGLDPSNPDANANQQIVQVEAPQVEKDQQPKQGQNAAEVILEQQDKSEKLPYKRENDGDLPESLRASQKRRIVIGAAPADKFRGFLCKLLAPSTERIESVASTEQHADEAAALEVQIQNLEDQEYEGFIRSLKQAEPYVRLMAKALDGQIQRK